MEALGFSLPTWAWATVFAVGVGGLIVWYAIVKPADDEKTVRQVLREKEVAQQRRTAEAIALQYVDPEKRDRMADELSKKWENERLKPPAASDDERPK